MFAVRTIRLCTKDCLCLYVCPTGASDTENGQIDWEKCIGCELCANACPSHAISMVPEKYAPQQKKDQKVVDALYALIDHKVKQEAILDYLWKTSDDAMTKQFALALKKSNRFMSEDLYREAGYMLPQSHQTHAMLGSFLKIKDPDFPMDAVKTLLKLIKPND